MMNNYFSNSNQPKFSENVFNGLTRFIKDIEPETEADPMALLISLLVSFGNIIGRNSYYEVEATKHYPNLFAVLVGDSSKARKGTSLAIVKNIFNNIDREWTEFNNKSGLSSGEGLKYNVRDAVKKQNEKGNEIITDKGVEDKRLLIVEAEFASALKVANRAGNTLSTSIRDAWDTGNLSTLTKNDPITAKNAHISILGHITIQELLRNLNDTEAANGYANRFLWVFVRRSKLLPFGGKIPFDDLPTGNIKKAIEFAQQPRKINMTADARELWASKYEKLSDAGIGLMGAVTSRAEAQIVRLSLIYALFDCSEMITSDHLQAALSVWNYCEASAKYIFGTKFGDDVIDTIFGKIQNNGNGGVSKTELHRLFTNNKHASEVERGISELLKHGKIRVKHELTTGRRTTIYELNENNEKSYE